MIELKQVHYKETHAYKETDIHFTFNNSYGFYTILEFKANKDVTHIIVYKTNRHTNSRFDPMSEITDTDFIQAFNKYFNYKITL